ncbi:hypothetical protein [Chitinophaga sp. LS1]|uniref:hypothetical protein n=1 Tax=Chitinophaga sp. LS1 TaxID=3051176 RepID=UPI002AAA7913|nr:hypothetical protein [Chitinophaga sp. LS1]WPV63915.1 hypothetical protein QQL36_19130 [Chitinophaga sp. LS1]
MIARDRKGDETAMGALGFEAALLFIPGGDEFKGLAVESKTLKSLNESILVGSKEILNSEGKTVTCFFVRNEEDLLKVAEDAAGGPLGNFTEEKPGRYIGYVQLTFLVSLKVH